ncbi:CRS2-associated factor 2, mitochondrial [Cicer arietinum]|uniref:CRS2-associated factor 2, mitochondrial n=1 Tax=Cicer arietinum TaxID=3827 RepID=A0A1S2XNT5_CICAR|nr:CRS2-associated factor 2, mitochondrial [Cicer arietinum]XP_027188806.1 CRS2-associated factor 2, mitochondrial [Cicer arietinum]XP_027188807.1 CRS2-associated factor 2, mitochondrial [Cicer arietinum]
MPNHLFSFTTRRIPFSLRRFLSQSIPHDPYDPPFSPTSKPQSKNNKKQKQNHNSNCDSNLPLKSNLPFNFVYSYSETNPSIKPISFRESPKFSPFGPNRLDRKWTGTSAPVHNEPDQKTIEADRNRILGAPLNDEEVADLVERYRHNDCNRQINLGKDGVTHNTLDSIHNHWKKAEAVRIKCLGVPTLDMDNVCFHLEEKSGGKIIYRKLNILLLYRGRHYDPKKRPIIPLMLWKPYAPIYPKLVKNVIDGLTYEETKELRNKGLESQPLMKLSRNGVYVNVVERVREGLKIEEVVRLDCSHVGTSDCKRIGVKLRDLVPCVPILFKDEQIIIWRGNLNQEQHKDL